MRDRISPLIPELGSKYGEKCETTQLTVIYELMSALLQGQEDEERYVRLDDGLELRLEALAINKRDTLYSVVCSYEDSVMGGMATLYLLRDLRAGRRLEQMTCTEDDEYQVLNNVFENEEMSSYVSDLVYGRMEQIRGEQINELVYHPRAEEFTASYLDAAQLVALLQEVRDEDMNNPQRGEAERDW